MSLSLLSPEGPSSRRRGLGVTEDVRCAERTKSRPDTVLPRNVCVGEPVVRRTPRSSTDLRREF